MANIFREILDDCVTIDDLLHILDDAKNIKEMYFDFLMFGWVIPIRKLQHRYPKASKGFEGIDEKLDALCKKLCDSVMNPVDNSGEIKISNRKAPNLEEWTAIKTEVEVLASEVFDIEVLYDNI